MFTSLINSNINDSFKESIFNGLSPDGSLYFPKKINALKDIIFNITSLSNKEIGFLVMKDFVNNEIPERKLKSIINNTINFDFPLKNIDSNIFSFELFHGPTLAFKDVGASFLAIREESFITAIRIARSTVFSIRSTYSSEIIISISISG